MKLPMSDAAVDTTAASFSSCVHGVTPFVDVDCLTVRHDYGLEC